MLRAMGRNVNRLRMGSGLTQQKLAERAEISLRYVQLIEAGKRNPSIPTVVRLKKVLTSEAGSRPVQSGGDANPLASKTWRFRSSWAYHRKRHHQYLSQLFP
jgi:transcriptional regulator with XRE-family HTH domain